MSEERFFKIESKLDSHDKDLHSIAKSLAGIDNHMEKTNQLLQESFLKDAKFENRINSVEMGMLARVEANKVSIEHLAEKVDNHSAVISRITWLVISFVVLAVIAAAINFK